MQTISRCTLVVMFALAACGAQSDKPKPTPHGVEPVANLPIICTQASADNGPMTACPDDKQKYDYAKPTDLVRWCNLAGAAQCSVGQLTWKQFAVLADTAKVDACVTPVMVGSTLASGSCGDWDQIEKNRLAQPDYFAAVPATGAAPLTSLLKWSVANVANCVASGDWQGNKGAQGEETVTIAVTSRYTLHCEGVANSTNGQARVSWGAPTQNVDGSQLTNLAGYRLVYGTDPKALSQIVEVPGATTTNYTVTGLSPATWYFQVKAFTSGNIESELSNTASKAIAASAGKVWEQSVTVTITGSTPIPKPPTNLTVEQVSALLYEDGHIEVKLAIAAPPGSSQ
jgi:hypothetical protein